MPKLVKINFNPSGEGTLNAIGLGEFPCLGRPGLKYPKDLTVDIISHPEHKNQLQHSVEFGVDMPFAILIWGQRGIWIHQFPDTLASNNGVTAGCIHLGPGNAKRFWDWVDSPTRVLIDYPW